MYILNQSKIETLINAATLVMHIEADGLKDIKTTFQPERKSFLCEMSYHDGAETHVRLPIGMFEAGVKAEDVFDKMINAHFEKEVKDLQTAK